MYTELLKKPRQDTLYTELLKKPRQDTLYTELLKKPRQDTLYTELLKKPRQDTLYTELLKKPMQDTLYTELLKKPRQDTLYTKLLKKPRQDTLYTELLKKPNDRTVQWVYDPLGNTGKTWFAKFFVIHENAIRFENAKSADIKYAYNGQVIAIFDFCRSLEDQVNYEVIENVKNCTFLSTKYDRQMKIFPIPQVCIFANFMPDLTKLSDDRLDICEIVQDNEATRTNNQVVYKFIHR